MGKSGPEEAAKGVVEGIKGKVKTLLGAVIGREAGGVALMSVILDRMRARSVSKG